MTDLRFLVGGDDSETTVSSEVTEGDRSLAAMVSVDSDEVDLFRECVSTDIDGTGGGSSTSWSSGIASSGDNCGSSSESGDAEMTSAVASGDVGAFTEEDFKPTTRGVERSEGVTTRRARVLALFGIGDMGRASTGGLVLVVVTCKAEACLARSTALAFVDDFGFGTASGAGRRVERFGAEERAAAAATAAFLADALEEAFPRLREGPSFSMRLKCCMAVRNPSSAELRRRRFCPAAAVVKAS